MQGGVLYLFLMDYKSFNSFQDYIDALSTEIFVRELIFHDGNIAKCAKSLGLLRTTFLAKLQNLGIAKNAKEFIEHYKLNPNKYSTNLKLYEKRWDVLIIDPKTAQHLTSFKLVLPVNESSQVPNIQKNIHSMFADKYQGCIVTATRVNPTTLHCAIISFIYQSPNVV
jgi:hypothetical protein